MISDRIEMANFNRGLIKDASYQVLFDLVKQFRKRRFFLEINQSEKKMPVAAMFDNGLQRNEHSL